MPWAPRWYVSRQFVDKFFEYLLVELAVGNGVLLSKERRSRHRKQSALGTSPYALRVSH